MIETVDVQIKVPKEGKEIVDAAAGIVEHFMAGKDIAMLSAQLPKVMAAFDGYEKVMQELESEQKEELAAYATWKIWEAIGVKKLGGPVQPGQPELPKQPGE